MPEQQFPGIFVEEVASGTRAIASVPTATTAFVGVTASGPVESPGMVGSFAEYEAQFGGLSADMPLGYAVQHYFLNGGREAVIARVVPSGATLTDADLSSPALETQQRGLWLLDRAERVNILCIPPLSRGGDVGRATWDAAIAYASRRRVMVVIDPPAAWAAAPTLADVAAVAGRSPNAALYYPRLQASDPLRKELASFAPCGAVAGIYARTDAARGVWKAPAGTEAKVLGAQGPSVALSQAQLAELNGMGVNACARSPAAQPCSGVRARGRRTMARTPSNFSRYGGSNCSSSRASPGGCNGRRSSRTDHRSGSGCARALKISCSASFARAHCRATRRSRRSSCVATPRP